LPENGEITITGIKNTPQCTTLILR